MVEWLRAPLLMANAIDRVKVQNTLALFCCNFRKDTLWHVAPTGRSWLADLHFSHISYNKLKKQNMAFRLESTFELDCSLCIVPLTLWCESGR